MKNHTNILIYDISYKTLIDPKPHLRTNNMKWKIMNFKKFVLKL